MKRGLIAGNGRFPFLPEGEIENSPGWSPPQRTEPWGRYPGKTVPSRRDGRNLPPHVARIVFNVVFLQESDELRLKIALSMMLFLASDVGKRRAHLGPPDGKCAIASCQSKLPIPQISCIHRDDALLISCIAFATARDEGRDNKR